ncbi:MAG: hypothetical protein LBC27_07195, partial [Spirochaetaceae bacterium]|nr:hypothetical protein [Spirochaetaceae bacterium]
RRFSGAKTALFGAARFRAPATSPPQGAPCLASQPLQSLARHKSVCLINLEMFFIFETGIAEIKAARE